MQRAEAAPHLGPGQAPFPSKGTVLPLRAATKESGAQGGEPHRHHLLSARRPRGTRRMAGVPLTSPRDTVPATGLPLRARGREVTFYTTRS